MSGSSDDVLMAITDVMEQFIATRFADLVWLLKGLLGGQSGPSHHQRRSAVSVEWARAFRSVGHSYFRWLPSPSTAMSPQG